METGSAGRDKGFGGVEHRVRGKHNLPDLGARNPCWRSQARSGVEQKTLHAGEFVTIGRNALRRILYLTDLDQELTWATRIRKSLTGLLYNLVTSAILKFVIRIIGGWDQSTWASLKGLEHFFTLPVEKKQKVRKMIPFMDYDEIGLENQVDNMIEILEWGDQIAHTIVSFSMIGHGVKDFDGTLKILYEIAEFGISRHPPRFWTGSALWDLWQSAAHLENPNPDFMKLLDRVTDAIQKDPVAFLKQAQKDRPISSDYNRAAFIGSHLGAYYVFTNRIEVPELIQKYLDRAIKENDEEYLVNYIQDLSVPFEMGYHQVTLAGLRPIANYKRESVRQEIGNFLVRARNYDPEYVEDLLLRGDFPQEIADRVLATPTSEHLTNLLTYQLASVVYDLFVLGPKPLRNELKWLYTKALDLPSFEEFIFLVIQEMLNIVLGEVVFNVPADAPSRQYPKGMVTT